MDNLDLASLCALHESATKQYGDSEQYLTEHVYKALEWANAAHRAFPALADRLEAAERERDALEEAFACSEGIMPDGELGPTKHNMVAWLADRDATMKALGAAEWLEAQKVSQDGWLQLTGGFIKSEAARLRREAGGK